MIKIYVYKGFTIGCYKVVKLMKLMDLRVKTKCSHKVTTDSKHKLPIAENILDREFNPDHLKILEKWCFSTFFYSLVRLKTRRVW